MADRSQNLKFDALRNAIYHTSRRGFLDFCSRVLNFIVVLGGTAAVADIGKLLDYSDTQTAFAALAAFAGLIQLVFDPAGLARTHEFLQRRFYELVAEISETAKPSEIDVARWESVINRLYAEEKPPMRALDAISYNAAVDSLGHGKEHRIPVNWFQSAMRQVLPFNGTSF